MKCSFQLAAGCAAIVLVAGSASAQRVDQRPAFTIPSAELLKLHEPGAPADLGIEVLLQEAHFRVEPDHRVTTTRRLVYRVLTQQGAEAWADVGTTYYPWHADKPEVKARVVTPDGREHWLQPATLVDSAASPPQDAVYAGQRRLSGPLPAIREGAVVEEQIVLREHRPYFATGIARRQVVDPGTFTHHYRVIVDAPKGMPLRYRLRGARGKPKQRLAGDRRILTFTFDGVKPLGEWLPFSGPDVTPVPVIELSTGASWQAVAKSYSDLVDASLQGFDAKTLSSALVASGDTRAVKIEKLLAYVHSQVRYTGLELGEHALVPAKPGEILGQHYGDCKDKATLLVGLLRSQGIEAHVALLEAGQGFDVPQKLPGLGLFDHAIVYVPGKKPLWIDATADKTAFGDLPYADQQRRALVASPRTTRLVATDAGRAAENLYREDIVVELVDGDYATLREITTGTGAMAGGLRDAYGATPTTLEKRFASYVEDRFGGRLGKYEARYVKDVSKPVELTLHVERAKNFESFDDGGFAPVTPTGLFRYLPDVLYTDEAKEAKRKRREDKQSEKEDPRFRTPKKQAVAVLPHTYEMAYQVTAPPGFGWEGLPEDIEVEAVGIQAWQRVRTEGERVLRVSFGVRSERQLVSAADLPRVQKVLSEFSDGSGARVRYVHRGDWDIAHGKVTAGLKRYRELMRDHPDDVRALSRYAQALTKLGFGAEGREAAKRLVKRFPKDAHAHWTLGYVLLFDTLGRDSYPGADPVLAAKHFRKALALEPDKPHHYRAVRTTMQLVTHGQARLSDATQREILRLLEEEQERFGEDEQRQEAILRGHLWLSEFDEALARVESMEETKARNVLWVAAVAGARGVDGAVAKATELTGGPPQQLLNEAASALALMGFAEAAYALGTAPAATRGMPNAQAMRRQLEALRDREKCLAKLTPAARALHDFVLPFVSYVDGEELIQDLKKQKHPTHTHVPSMQAVLGRMRRESGGSNTVRLWATQVGACMRTWHEERVDGAIRVRVYREGTTADRSSITWYMRKVGQRYVPVGAQDRGSMAALGRQAMHALKRRKPAEARAWLNWAHEHLAHRTLSKDWYWSLEAFRELWPADLEQASVEDLWAVAATLSTWDPMGAPEERVFRRALQREQTEAHELALRFGLAVALSGRDRHEEAAEVLFALHQKRPTDRGLWQTWLYQLGKGKQDERLLAELPALEQAFSDAEDFARRWRSIALRRTGRFGELLVETRRRKAAGEAKAGELNNVAWAALFYDGDLKAAIELAQESSRLDRDSSVLHTLATLQAEVQDYDQAHTNLREAIQKGDRRRALPAWWLTHAMIADALGLKVSAADAFARVEPPEAPDDVGSFALYERWKAKHSGR